MTGVEEERAGRADALHTHRGVFIPAERRHSKYFVPNLPENLGTLLHPTFRRSLLTNSNFHTPFRAA